MCRTKDSFCTSNGLINFIHGIWYSNFRWERQFGELAQSLKLSVSKCKSNWNSVSATTEIETKTLNGGWWWGKMALHTMAIEVKMVNHYYRNGFWSCRLVSATIRPGRPGPNNDFSPGSNGYGTAGSFSRGWSHQLGLKDDLLVLVGGSNSNQKSF